MIPMLSGFLGPIIDKALAFIPDPEQRTRARLQLEQQMQDSEKDFQDFVVAYEGRGDQVHPAVQILRSSVRPVCTYGFAIGLFAAIWTNQPVAILDMLFKLNLLTLSFWFGSKALERLGINGKSMKGMLKK